MLKDGTLPPGYTVKKRRLCEVDADGRAVPVKKDKKKKKKKKAKQKAKASEKAKAAEKARKKVEKAARVAA